MDGILNVNKPQGRTSFSIVAMVKRLSGERRVGHAGTLDPSATGVLPTCLGQGTRITQYLQETPKTYRARIELGIATDTYDACGQVTSKDDPSGITPQQLESALAYFHGVIRQTPPMYSAVKHGGKRLYQLARAGITVKRNSRLARIHSLHLIDWQAPLATVDVVCGKGTYIRSLAHDLGQALGCGAILKNLIRLRYGQFDIEDAISISQLEDAFKSGCWQQYVHPIDTALLHYPAITVSDANTGLISNGIPLMLETSDSAQQPDAKSRCRAYTKDGRLLAILSFDPETGKWQPEKVFPASAP